MKNCTILSGPIAAAFGLTILVGCDLRVPQQAEQQIKQNVSEKRIFLKDLTTGVELSSLKLDKLKRVNAETASFDYQYFGKPKTFVAKVNEDGRVISYSLTTEDPIFIDLRDAISEKLSSENGRPVQFDCQTSPFELGEVRFKIEECKIVSGEQALTLSHKYVTSPRPNNVDPATWYKAFNFPVELTLAENIKLDPATQDKLSRQRAAKEAAAKDVVLKARRDL